MPKKKKKDEHVYGKSTLDVSVIPRQTHRTYTDVQKKTAVAYYTLGYSITKLSEDLDIPYGTLWDWCHGYNLDDMEIKEIAEKIRGSISDRLIINANRAIAEAMTDKKLAKAGFKDLLIGSGIMMQNHRLFNNESTSNVHVATERVKRIKDKNDSLASRQAKLEAEIAGLEQSDNTD